MLKYLCLVILLCSSILNFKTDFGFSLNSSVLTGLWLFFYAILLPIGLLKFVYSKYRNETSFNIINLSVFSFYLISLLISCLGFFNFDDLTINGDGTSVFIIKIILFVCLICSFVTFLFFKMKYKRQLKK